MAIHEQIIPKTGLNMEDSYLLDWIAEEGEKVEEGEPLAQTAGIFGKFKKISRS